MLGCIQICPGSQVGHAWCSFFITGRFLYSNFLVIFCAIVIVHFSFTYAVNPQYIAIFVLDQGQQTFFCKGPDSKYCRHCRPSGLCLNYSTLSLRCESCHRQCIKEWVLLCSNRTSLTKTGSG